MDRNLTKKIFSYSAAFFALISVPILAISFAATIPCLFKSFYRPWISILDIPNYSGFTKDQILYAYNGLMNFIRKGGEFDIGLKASEEGIQHFRECVPLFWLQPFLFLSTLLYLFVYFVLLKNKTIERIDLFKIPLLSYGSFIGIVFIAIILTSSAIDFYETFTLFHKIAFPGKTNFEFYPDKDEVIMILPESYFAVCTIFIVFISLWIMIGFIIYGLRTRNNNSKIIMKKLSKNKL